MSLMTRWFVTNLLSKIQSLVRKSMTHVPEIVCCFGEPWKNVPRNEREQYFSDALLCFAAKPLHAIRKMFIGIFTVNKNL